MPTNSENIGDSIAHWLPILENLLPVVVAIVVVALLVVAITVLVLNLLDLRRLFKQKLVFLELTPPAQGDKAPEATQHLFAVLHGLEGNRSLLDKLLRRKVAFALEVVSTREQGIRYIVRVAEGDVSTFEQAILSYVPDVKVREIADYLPQNLAGAHILEFKQTGHFAYPLQTQGKLEQHDPIAYLTGTMTKLAPEEMVVFQAVVSPTKVREAEIIGKKILGNEDLIYRLGKRRWPSATKLFTAINSVLLGATSAAGNVYHGSTKQSYQASQRDAQEKLQVAKRLRPARTLSAFELELVESIHRKVNQPLFAVNIRAMVVARSEQATHQRAAGIRSALASFNVPKYQALKARWQFPMRLRGRYRLFAFRHRLPSIFRRSSCLLAASEIADLYHFPHSETAKTENVVKSLSKTLPAPISLKGQTNFDIILGRNHHHGTSTDIGLTAKERERHVFVVGGTGNGKTTMMVYAMVQSIRRGEGFAFIDPHGDAAESLLGYIPENRVQDVVYFNPDDLAYPIGLNLLELPPDLAGDELLRAKDLVTESVVSVFRKIFSEDDSGGHRIEYVLRNTVQTALTVKDATLFTIYHLLNDPDYRKTVIRNLEDKDLVNFWKNELGKAGNFQQVKMAAGITAKIGRFLFSASAKRILEQPKSTIDFDEILDGKILICNFSKGLLGEDTSELFGIAVLAKVQMAALRRARVKQTQRRPFYLYVDEFQNFATMSFVQMLSEARKYKLFLMMAEQSTSQQDDQQMVNVILANVGTIICFRTGNPADEQYLLPLFQPYVAEGEIANLPSFNFYMRIAAVQAQESFSGETIVLEEEGDEVMAERVVAASRGNYAIEYVEPPKKEEKSKAAKKPRTTGKQKTTNKTVIKETQSPKPLLPKKDRLKR